MSMTMRTMMPEGTSDGLDWYENWDTIQQFYDGSADDNFLDKVILDVPTIKKEMAQRSNQFRYLNHCYCHPVAAKTKDVESVKNSNDDDENMKLTGTIPDESERIVDDEMTEPNEEEAETEDDGEGEGETFHDRDMDCCPICLLELQIQQKKERHETSKDNDDVEKQIQQQQQQRLLVVQSTKCLHTFHEDCLAQWFQRSPLCPCCRVRIWE